MRLIELEIENVRGIRHLILRPQGQNLAIWGPNGSGKSAVVDAIDFLLTGTIGRLAGKGAGNLSLSRHGPHIDCKPEEAKVRAIVKLNGVREPVEITRCIDHPNTYTCKGIDRASLDSVLAIARRGHHVLTRRDILRYITAEGSTRAQEIQELLNVSEVENIRKALVSVQNSLSKELQAARQAVKTAEGGVCATLGLSKFDVAAILALINRNRAIFGQPPIGELRSSEIKRDLSLPPAASGAQTVNVTLIESDIDHLREVLGPLSQTTVAEVDGQLRDVLRDVRADPSVLRSLSLRELIDLGLGLLDDTGSCPLCETPWPEGELRRRLERRLSTATAAQQAIAKVETLAGSLSASITTALGSLGKVIAVAQLLDLADVHSALKRWESDLRSLHTDVTSALRSYPSAGLSEGAVARMMAPRDAIAALDKALAAAKLRFPDATPEQTAWDTLTRLEENLKALESAQLQLKGRNLSVGRAVTLATEFEHARDLVLKTLYDEVKDRFVELYRALHDEDEQSFSATLQPSGAALDFAVDFHGRGVHPPHALHSEGHQDSMGLCLYLALAEHLTGGVFDLVILDDVVMSVDAEHRRQICRLLATVFPHRQFLITTHDRTWATQLRLEGLVQSRSTVEFSGWDIDGGPRVNVEAELWDLIKVDLERNDVSAASARLRRGAEEYFSKVCDALQAFVRFRLDGRWELGDLLPAAMKQYKSLLKAAKAAASSWDQRERVTQLAEIESIASNILSRTNAEQWAVNASVHYNNWANLAPPDFVPVVDAFHDLFDLFRCQACGAVLYLTLSGSTHVSLRCNCGKVDWNLVGKSNAG